MAKSLFTKLVVPTVAVSVLGFSTVVSMDQAFAAKGGNSNKNNKETEVVQSSSNENTSTSVAQTSVINTPNGKAISNVVLYLKDDSGNITKVKIDNFSDVSGEAKSYDATSILQQYPNSQLVAYTVKAGNNKSGMGPGEGELFLIADSGVNQSQLPTGSVDQSYEYKNVYNIPSTPQSENNTTTYFDDTNEVTQNMQPDITETQKVPEPGTVAALAFFGLGGLVTKKRLIFSR